jgi:protoporphyrin/coproporphyrin ferrochelatase
MALHRPELPYTHGSAPRTGILLTNLGSPDEPTAPALRRYLRQFLSDPRVVEIFRPLWWLILNGIILVVRPKKSAAKYETIWTKEGSPLKVHTARQALKLQGFMHKEGIDVPVEVGMRYANPSIASGLEKLKAQGCDRILVLPLYPQYAASTTASTYDAVSQWAGRLRNLPGINFVRNFHDHPAYIAALAASVREHWMREGGQPDVLLMSFHGLPRRTLDLGDPYHCECLKTGRLLTEALGLRKDQVRITFQSRFGRAEWLKPYTAATLEALGHAGTGRIDVMCPGFTSDCLETLEEISMEGRETFLHAGGKQFTYIPCLNERDDWIFTLCNLVKPHLAAMARPEMSTAVLSAQSSDAKALGAKQ